MCHNRLLLVGPARELKRFGRSDWETKARARFLDVLECSDTRLSFQFESGEPPLAYMKTASRRWRTLTFLLDYEIEELGLKGLAKAHGGALETCLVHYAP